MGKREQKIQNTVAIKITYATKQKQKYRGMFETQKSGNKTSSGDIGLNTRTLARGPGVRRSKRPLLACRTRCKCSMETIVIGSKIGVMPDQWRVSL